MTSMNQEGSLFHLVKTSRNSTANRNAACDSGAHKHFAIPTIPPLEWGRGGSPQRQLCPAATPKRCRTPVKLRLLPLPPPALWDHVSPTAQPAFMYPQVNRGRGKACLRKWGLASAGVCFAVFYWPPHHTPTRGVPAPTVPWWDTMHPPHAGTCASLSCCPAAMAHKMVSS